MKCTVKMIKFVRLLIRGEFMRDFMKFLCSDVSWHLGRQLLELRFKILIAGVIFYAI